MRRACASASAAPRGTLPLVEFSDGKGDGPVPGVAAALVNGEATGRPGGGGAGVEEEAAPEPLGDVPRAAGDFERLKKPITLYTWPLLESELAFKRRASSQQQGRIFVIKKLASRVCTTGAKKRDHFPPP